MFWFVPEFFRTVFPTGSLTTSTGTFLASATLSQPWESTCEFPITSQLSAWECFRGCESVSRGRESTLSWPQLSFSGTSSSLSRPLKHLKASIDTLTASTDTLTASKALSRPLQSTSTQLACTFSRLWECCILTLLQQSHGRIRIRIHTSPD